MKKIINFFKRVDWGSVPIDVWVRYVLMFITIINTLLTRFGLNPISASEESIYQTVSDVVTVLILLINTWKNNSVTPEAIEADKYMKELKENPTEEPEEAQG